MAVYFARRVSDGLVKIGYTYSPIAVRMRKLRHSIGEEVELIRVITGGADTEKYVHLRFHGSRSHSEWFSYDPEMLTFELPAFVSVRDSGREAMRMVESAITENNECGNSDAHVIAMIGGHIVVAEYCGVSRENARHWAAGRTPIPWKHRKAVHALAKEKRVRLPADFLHERRAAA